MAEEEVNATDAAIAIAEAEDVDLAEVTGSGEDGRVIKEDVEAYLREQREEDEDEAAEPSGPTTAADVPGEGPFGSEIVPPPEANEPLAVDKPEAAEGLIVSDEIARSARDLDFPGTRNEDDEEEPVIVGEGSWVQLAYDSDNIPDHLKGHWASIVDAPRYSCEDPTCVDFGHFHEHQPENTPITVRTRDAYNQLLVLTRADFSDYSTGVPTTRV